MVYTNWTYLGGHKALFKCCNAFIGQGYYLFLIKPSFLSFFQQTKKDISTIEDPFDAPTYNIPEKPVTFTEGASYSLIILVGIGIAAAAGYAVFKELIFEPKEYELAFILKYF